MEEFVWRSRVRIVAIVDLGMIGLSVILAVFLASGIGSVAESTASYYGLDVDMTTGGNTISRPPVSTEINWMTAIVIAVSILVVGLQLFAAVMLLMAGTKIDGIKWTLRRALLWRDVTILFIMLIIAAQLKSLNILGLIITFAWKGSSYYIVHKFIDELVAFLKARKDAHDNHTDNADAK